MAYRHLLEQFEEMLVEEPRAWEGLDPEGVHQLRVATRRIRAALREFKRVLSAKPAKAFNREFKWVAAVLGDIRDLDVYQDNFRHYATEISEEDSAYLIDYRNHLANLWKKSRGELIACLSSQRFQHSGSSPARRF